MRISDWSSDVCSSDLLRLPDTHDANPVLRNARGVDQTIADCERTDPGREIAAVSGPVAEGIVERHLPAPTVVVVLGFCALGQERALRHRRRRASHTIAWSPVRDSRSDPSRPEKIRQKT